MFLCLLLCSFGLDDATCTLAYGYPFRESSVGDLLDEIIAFATHSTSRRCDQCQYRATMLPRHFHLPLFRRTKETEPQASLLIAPPNARPNIWRSSLGIKLRTRPYPLIQTERDPGSRPSLVHACSLQRYTDPTARLHELHVSASSYQFRRSLSSLDEPSSLRLGLCSSS